MNEKNIVSIDAVIDIIKICGYIDCNEHDGYYDEYEYDNILYYLEKYKNLQSKIDKAIEYAKDNLPERDYMGCLLTDEDVTLNRILEKLLDILKENKYE